MAGSFFVRFIIYSHFIIRISTFSYIGVCYPLSNNGSGARANCKGWFYATFSSP